jgi:phosphoglycolate phosphatase
LKNNINQGVTQSILSAYKHSTLLEIVEHFKLKQYFIELIGQDDIYAHGKIEQGKNWIDRLGIDRNDVVMIGDTYHDYEVAKEIGVDCILISHGYNSRIKLNSTGMIVIENLKELEKVL